MDELMNSRSVVVTGVSTGIGRGIVGALVQHGFRVFGTVRKESDAAGLRAEFGDAFMPLFMDVTDQSAVLLAAEQVQTFLGKSNLAGLVNNAGISLVGPLLHQPLEDLRIQLEVNLIAPLRVTQAFAPLLGTEKSRLGGPGRIVNISSVGGKMAFPYLGAYAASKHGLEGLSESLRRELLLYGIDVIVVEPGYTDTPILDKAQSEDYARYRQTDYAASLEAFRTAFIAEGRNGLPPRSIGEAVWKALTVSSPRVAYPVMREKFKNWTLPQLLPKRVLDRLVGKQFGLLPPL
jgi:NAD(P)-dependent dehydrogenase (short-subunit alcohol dehydrogenase family)